MSWLFGFAGEVTAEILSSLERVHSTPAYSSESSTHYVQAGGLSETCWHGQPPNRKSEWFATGVGLLEGTLLSQQQWTLLFSEQAPPLDTIDGHFVAARISKNRVLLYTDQLGTRTLHYGRYQSGYAFSSRIDWLARLFEGLEIDYSTFGSHWITFNQLSTKSQIKKLQRLGPGGRLVLFRNSPQKAPLISEKPWSCDISNADTTGSSYIDRLSRYCTAQGTAKVSLGLSGGLDSRLLLSLFGHQTHVFGPSDLPDVIVSKKIAEQESIPQRHLHDPALNLESGLALLYTRSELTHVISPASSVLDLNYYSQLHDEGFCIIDGGFGEVARRQFMNRLLRFYGVARNKNRSIENQHSLTIDGINYSFRPTISSGSLNIDPIDFLQYIRVHRASSVFSREVRRKMVHGAIDEITELLKGVPPGLDSSNAIDLIGVRTRLPNFFGFEQNRLDNLALCFMPFAQPSVLKALFQVPLSLRKNGKLFKRTIRKRNPRLARFPLVKGTTQYPFYLSTVGSYLYTRIKKKAGMGYHDHRPQQFLKTLKPFVMDLVRSQKVRSYTPYQHNNLSQIVEDYYNGNESLAGTVDWWLAFEVWRQTLQGKA